MHIPDDRPPPDRPARDTTAPDVVALDARAAHVVRNHRRAVAAIDRTPFTAPAADEDVVPASLDPMGAHIFRGNPSQHSRSTR
ncbi:hypothetical protein J2S58_001904 [Nakamurella flavida]|nr:hypothetical protein [Nakamurella flavida]